MKTTKKEKQPLSFNKQFGQYKLPPKKLINMVNNDEIYNKKRYIEYRSGLLTSVCGLFANRTLNEEHKKNHFINSVMVSKEIPDLLFNTTLIESLDRVDGLPKLILTIISKYFEANYLSQ